MAGCNPSGGGVLEQIKGLLGEIIDDPGCVAEEVVLGTISSVVANLRTTLNTAFQNWFLGVPVPTPAGSSAFAFEAAGSGIWSRIYAQNDQFTIAAFIFIGLGAAIGLSLGAIRAISRREQNTIVRRSILGGTFLIFHKPVLAAVLEFVNVLTALVWPDWTCTWNYTIGGILNGTVLAATVTYLGPFSVMHLAGVLIMVGMFAVVQIVIDLAIYATFLFAPLFIAAWAVGLGPLEALGEKGKNGLRMFLTFGLANIPFGIVMRTMCTIFPPDWNNLTVSDAGVGDVIAAGAANLALVFITTGTVAVGLYVTYAWTKAGNMAISGVEKAAGSAYAAANGGGGVGAGLAAAGVSPRYAQGVGRAATEKANDMAGPDDSYDDLEYEDDPFDDDDDDDSGTGTPSPSPSNRNNGGPSDDGSGGDRNNGGPSGPGGGGRRPPPGSSSAESNTPTGTPGSGNGGDGGNTGSSSVTERYDPDADKMSSTKEVADAAVKAEGAAERVFGGESAFSDSTEHFMTNSAASVNEALGDKMGMEKMEDINAAGNQAIKDYGQAIEDGEIEAEALMEDPDINSREEAREAFESAATEAVGEYRSEADSMQELIDANQRGVTEAAQWAGVSR